MPKIEMLGLMLLKYIQSSATTKLKNSGYNGKGKNTKESGSNQKQPLENQDWAPFNNVYLHLNPEHFSWLFQNHNKLNTKNI